MKDDLDHRIGTPVHGRTEWCQEASNSDLGDQTKPQHIVDISRYIIKLSLELDWPNDYLICAKYFADK